MKQQFTGSYTLDVASRAIVLSGIEIPPERLAVVINSSVGFVYHNIEHEPTASVTASGGVTTIVFPVYKDCETHRNTDSLSIFYDDGVDLGQLIKDESDETQALLQTEFDDTRTTITDFRTEVKAESDETQALLQTEFDDTRTTITDFRTEVKAESDETQALLQTEFDDLRALLPPFQAEVKAESDETQALLQTEFDETRTALTDFRAEVKAESDETQALLQTEFDDTRTALTDFRTEVKAESDETQALLQTEFDDTRTALTDFRTEVKAESDETQSLLDAKLPDPIAGRIPVETLGKYEPTNDVEINMSYGSFGMSQVVFSKAGTTLKTLNMNYDAEGNLVSVVPA